MTRMTRTTKPLALVAACLLPTIFCAGKVAAQGMRAAPVRVVEAVMLPMAPTISVPGTVLSRDYAAVASELSGRLVTVAEIGSTVAAGEPVATIEDLGFSLQKEENEGLVARAEARIPFLESEVERLRRLARQNNAAKSQLQQTEADLAVARQDFQVARARLRLAQVQLAKTRIVAPFDGLVTERLARPGEMVGPGDEVVRLVNPGRLEVVARAPLKAVAFIEPGAALGVAGIRDGGTGKVRTLVPFGDARSHLFEMRLDVPADGYSIGEQVRVSIPTAGRKAVLAVPRDALVLRADGAAVFRVGPDSTAERVPVKPGTGDADMIAISGAIEPGDKIIVRGAERLMPGQPVSVIGGAPGDPGVAGAP